MLELIVVGDGAVVFCFTEATSNAILPPAAVLPVTVSGNWVDRTIVLRLVVRSAIEATAAPTACPSALQPRLLANADFLSTTGARAVDSHSPLLLRLKLEPMGQTRTLTEMIWMMPSIL